MTEREALSPIATVHISKEEAFWAALSGIVIAIGFHLWFPVVIGGTMMGVSGAILTSLRESGEKSS